MVVGLEPHRAALGQTFAPPGYQPILIVDDDAALARALARGLRGRGFEVIVTNSPFGVLNLVADTRPSLVVMDVTLPGLDGGAATQLIRGDRDLEGTVVVLYSALDEAELARIASRCRADAYLRKGSLAAPAVDAFARAALHGLEAAAKTA